MAGKAIQAKRWILVEPTQSEDDDIERIING